MAREGMLIGADAICGFSLSFCEALRNKIDELLTEGEILVLTDQGHTRPKKKGEWPLERVYPLMPLAGMLFDHLSGQLKLREDSGELYTVEDILEYLALVDEFLKIFEKK